MYPTIKDIHFVGIGGIGMSGLAEILLTMGCRVTGSDLKRSPVTDRLKRRGARISFGHKADNVSAANPPQLVVVSSAVSKNNPEMGEAVKRGIPVISRGEMLAELMRLKYGIAVAGSHGKTTTTSLTAAVLDAGGFDPTLVIGGRVKSLRTNARLGKGDFLVAEADESDGSFLHLNPTIAVVTNVDREHMDHYKDFESLKKTFEAFVAKIPFYGVAIFCADHPETARLAANFAKRGFTYGIREKADYQATNIKAKGWGSDFDVKFRGENLGRIRLRQPGLHNVQNSLAAIAVGRELGVKFSDIKKALGSFKGIGRRLELVHEGDITVVDDYGHHPVEMEATISALRSAMKKERLWVLFQPHRYTRTKDLFDDFAKSFGQADHVVMTEIYAASEEPIRGVSGEALADAVKKEGGDVMFVPRVSEIADAVFPRLKKGDVVLTLGAGDIWKAGKELAKKFHG
ncbi:MAG TPA: UDP-N-acetylmuramate--L-alanine ligase [bacterium]|nr:UDP-N-acetylmuramate--L-alanine ligase [bacterium]